MGAAISPNQRIYNFRARDDRSWNGRDREQVGRASCVCETENASQRQARRRLPDRRSSFDRLGCARARGRQTGAQGPRAFHDPCVGTGSKVQNLQEPAGLRGQTPVRPSHRRSKARLGIIREARSRMSRPLAHGAEVDRPDWRLDPTPRAGNTSRERNVGDWDWLRGLGWGASRCLF